MRLSDFLSEHLMLLDLDVENKIDAFKALVSSMAQQRVINEPKTFLDEVIAREAIEPTCIGHGIALPHTRTRCVERPTIAFARNLRGIPFTPTRTEEVQLIFMMGTPKDEANQYLQILARLCRLLRRNEFRDKLLAAASPKEILQLFNDFDSPLN